MTPEQLEILRSGLTPLNETSVSPALLANYCQFYHLDFAIRHPDISHRIGTVPSNAFTLAVQQWCQPNATSHLLLVHGYFDHTGIFGKLVEWAIEQRCNVTIFDLPGHGLSSGEPVSIDSFQDYAQAIDDVLKVVAEPNLPLWAMGQSTGGAALIEYARRYKWPFVATVLLAPLIRPAGWRKISIAQRFVRLFTKTIPRTFVVNSSDDAFLTFLKSEPLQSQHTSLRWVDALRNWLDDLQFEDLGVGPVLIVQGDADGTVDWRYNIPRLLALFPHSAVASLAGAGHQLANESQVLRDSYLATVKQYLIEKGLSPGP